MRPKTLSRDELNRILHMRAQGLKQYVIAEELNREGFRTNKGEPLCGLNISKFLVEFGVRSKRPKGKKIHRPIQRDMTWESSADPSNQDLIDSQYSRVELPQGKPK